MRIVITGPGTASANGKTVAATPFVLGDDTVEALNGSAFPNGAGGLVKPGFMPRLVLATQRDEFINAKYAQELPRGNAQMTYTFQVERRFATSDQALLFLRDHAALVPPTGKLAVTIGGSTAYLANAVLKDCSATEHTNLTCVFSYTYAGSYIPPISGAAGTGTGGPFTAS